jgi:DNA-binding NtrC family response regulator
MAFRIAAKIGDRVMRLPLITGELLLGSHPDCPLRLAHSSVSRRHAVVRVAGGAVEVEDLGSRNGVRRGGERIAATVWRPGERLSFGAVEAFLEEVGDADTELALALAPAPGAAAARDHAETGQSTFGSEPAALFLGQHLSGLLRRLLAEPSPTEMAQAVGHAVFSSLPCTLVEVATAAGGTIYHAEREGAALETIEPRAGTLLLRCSFPAPRLAGHFAPVLDTAALLLLLAQGLSGRRAPAGRDAPALPAPPDPPSATPQVRDIYEMAARVAGGSIGVLILGESGTGKELLARYLHDASRVAGGPFLALNCASLPRDLLESELFGVEKGVATGVDARPGKFEQASGGTLFLDEIADMAPETQAKILRVLQSGEVHRLGGLEARRVAVRTIAATNRDVRALLSSGAFREDLYHRIAGWVVELPPLRRRRADILNLAAHFLARETSRRGVRAAGVSRAAVDRLLAYPWPGNIRQLENEIARAALFLEDGEMLDTARLSEEVRRGEAGGGRGLAAILESVERDEITLALEASGGNVDVAAAALGISRATLYRRIATLGILHGG